jgi:hypothetical protein
MSEFKNIRFFDGMKEITVDTAIKEDYFLKALAYAKIHFNSVIDDINYHNATLMINQPVNNPNKENSIWIDNVSPELRQILDSIQNN